MEQKTIERISVNELLAVSGVSRASFYRHFRDKYDLLNWACGIRLLQITEKALADDFGNWYRAILASLEYVEKNKVIFQNATQAQGQNSFLRFAYDLFVDFYTQTYLRHAKQRHLSTEQKWEMAFFVSGWFHLANEWLELNCAAPAEMLAEFICRRMPQPHAPSTGPLPI